MKPLLEGASFLALAVAAHVGAFALVAQGGASAGGDGGAGQITLEGGAPGLAEMVAAWNRSPELVVPPEPLSEPPAALPSGQAALSDSAEVLPLTAAEGPVLPTLERMAPAAPRADAMPETTPPAPPVAWMPAPTPAPAPPDPAQADDILPQRPAGLAPALPDLRVPTGETTALRTADALPDTTPPPPMALAQPLARSPHPPARPLPRAEPPARSQSRPAGAAPAQRAAGTGAQGHEGQAGQSRQTSHVQVDTGGLVAQWGGAVRAAVQRQQRHPAGVRRGGTVLLRLEVHSDGRLIGVALQQSSGHAALDQAALDAARRASIPAAPHGLSGRYQFNLPVRFQG